MQQTRYVKYVCQQTGSDVSGFRTCAFWQRVWRHQALHTNHINTGVMRMVVDH